MGEGVCREFLEELDLRYKESKTERPRAHLGGSVIGEDCLAKIWFGFRWAAESDIDGKLYRLFNRGHREEEVFVEYLKLMGHRVEKVLDDQQRILDCFGHFGGALDGFIYDPFGFPKGKYMLEFKTYNLKRFKNLVDLGVELSDPKYYRQVQVYMSYFPEVQETGTLFFAVCKDNDKLELQHVPYNAEVATEQKQKAELIITSEEVPEKTGTFVGCKFCDFSSVCKEGSAPKVSCRSCRNCTVFEGGWKCELTEKVLSVNEQVIACESYERLF